MDITLRMVEQRDLDSCGRICFDAFHSIASKHGFNADFPSAEISTGLLTGLSQHPGFYGVVAEVNGEVVGSNFVDERGSIGGIGPVTVAPGVQDLGVGRHLMEHVIARADGKGMALRLTQAAYHSRSLSLYSKLGFAVREPLCVMQGEGSASVPDGRTVRPAEVGDQTACSALCRAVHGHERDGEFADAVSQGLARVVEHGGRITGYASLLGYFGHAVAESNDDLKALIAGSGEIQGPGFLLPARNGEVMRWCLENGLCVKHTATLMARGDYQEPVGAFLPSILY